MLKAKLKSWYNEAMTGTTRDIVLAVLIGVLAGLSSTFIIKTESMIEGFLYSTHTQELGLGQIFRLKDLVILSLPLIGAIFYIVLKSVFFQEQKMGYSFPDFIVNVNRKEARINPMTILYLLLFTPIIIGTGNMAGVEGPIAQIGGGFGSFLSGIMKEENRKRRKLLIASGTAAGIASIFNAPITGVFFAIEIVLLGEYELTAISVIVISAVTATLVTRAFIGNHPLLGTPLYEYAGVHEFIGYTFLGVFVGIFSVLFEKWFFKAADYFKKMTVKPMARPLIGSIIIGFIGVLLPMSLGNGYPVIRMALLGKISFTLIGFLFVAKFIGTAITIGSGLPGGIYAPSLYIGAMLGGTIGFVFNSLFPAEPVSTGVYATLGMSAFLASLTHAPFTGIFLVFELTNDYRMMLPFMVTTIIAMLIKARLFPDSIEHYPIREYIKHIEHRDSNDS
ncbi:MAG: chloride channel protein [Deltaproteobacteria bacterium]|nr:chloride channel protein [Deltaproteobacteria bacterium]MCL5277704.1 chloride channel protein [Deltaproteobacteria bacterium]